MAIIQGGKAGTLEQQQAARNDPTYGTKGAAKSSSVSTGGIDTNYQIQPGETNAAYTARIAAYNAAKNTEASAGGSTTKAQTGTLNAKIQSPSTTKVVGTPVVIDSKAAETDLANKRQQMNQLDQDTTQHQALVSQPQSTQPQLDQSKPESSQAQPMTTDQKIDSLIDFLGSETQAIQENAQDELTPLQQQQQQVQNALDTATAKSLKQLSQVASGTYPLSAAEKNLIDSTTQTFQATIAAQETANQAYAGQMTELAASLGINTSAPTQAIGLIHAAVSAGTGKVADLNAQMSQSIANLQLGFQKQDYDMVSDYWDKTATAFNDRIKTLQDMQKSVTDAAKQQQQDIKDNATFALSAIMDSNQITYQQKQLALQTAQLDESTRHNLITEAQSRYEITGTGQVFDKATGQLVQSPDGAQTSDAFASTIKLAASTGGTNAQRASISQNLQDFIANGDYKSAYSALTNATANGLTGAAATNFRQAVTEQGVLKDLKDSIQEYADAGGNTNLLKGSADEIQKKLGTLETDPKYAALATQIDMNFQAYRQQMTGAAFGAKESSEYAKVLPSKSNTLDLNLATIQGASNYYDSFIDNTMKQVVGEGGKYVREYAEGGKKSPQDVSADNAEDTLSTYIASHPDESTDIQGLLDQYSPEQILTIFPEYASN